jgi:coenzyme F420 hydrogenase subunit beta
MNIGGGKFIINLKSGEQMDVPLKEVQKYARDNCHFCEDLTSDYADISVGSIGSQDGWSSVITRSKDADKLYNDIVKTGLVESKSLKDVKPGQFLVEKIGGTKRTKCKAINLKEIKDGH